MGCTASKLDNEDTVRRCKERRRLMKAAVYARHHLAAAHSDYCRSLRLTGTALTAFAAGEPLSVSDHAPAVLLRTPSSLSSATTATTVKPPRPPQSHHHIHSQSQQPAPSPTIASSKLPHILSSSSHQARKKKPVKLPHILSDSSFTSSPKPHHDFNDDTFFTYNAKANSSYADTPSQTSSVWNWENFYPPSPPDSEYFEQLKNKKNPSDNRSDVDDDEEEDEKRSRYSVRSKYSQDGIHNQQIQQHHQNNHINKRFDFFDDDKASNYSSYSSYSRNESRMNENVFARKNGVGISPHHLNRWDSEEEEETERETEREEVQCSEWGDHDHYSTTSSSSSGDDEAGERDSRSGIGTRSKVESKINSTATASVSSKMGFDPSSKIKMNSGAAAAAAKFSEKFSSSDGSSTVSWGNNNGKGDREMVADRRIVVRHKDLVEIVSALKEYFDKAAAAGEQVSGMLEIGKAQLDRNFSKLKKTVYHSSGVFSNLSSSWTSKPPLVVKYKFEPGSLEESGGTKSLCSTLERLLAWEKKLYEEVKAREGVKIEHEKKLSALQSQECRGDDESKLDKTKASITRLQSLILVTSQAVSTTSSAIIGLRDSELVPQLVELCHGFMYMWRSMNQFHEVQNDIVQQVRGLVNRASKGESTSDLHRQATRDLESAVSSWHSSFCRMIKFQRDFIRSLHGWFKLTALPVTSEQNNNNNNNQPSEVFTFCDEWKLALDRIPDTVASEAVKSFINVVHSIALKQAEELKIKKRTDSASKELEKKASSLRNIEKKYYNSYSMVGISLPDTGPDNGHALDARDPLAEKKIELAACRRRVEDEMMKYSKAVDVTRAMTLNNIQTGLPGVFQALTSFSALITEALEAVCTSSYAIK